MSNFLVNFSHSKLQPKPTQLSFQLNTRADVKKILLPFEKLTTNFANLTYVVATIWMPQGAAPNFWSLRIAVTTLNSRCAHWEVTAALRLIAKMKDVVFLQRSSPKMFLATILEQFETLGRRSSVLSLLQSIADCDKNRRSFVQPQRRERVVQQPKVCFTTMRRGGNANQNWQTFWKQKKESGHILWRLREE